MHHSDDLGDDELADLHSNWAAWLAVMARHIDGGETQQFGSVSVSSLGVPMPLFNQALVFDDPVVDDVAQATAWLTERNVPFWVTTPGHLSGAIAEIAQQLGLAPEIGAMPGMVLGSLTGLEPEIPSGLEIVPVTQPDQLDTVVAATADGFGAPPEMARHLAPESMLDDDSMQWFVGSVDGEPATCGQLLLTDGVAGVYTMAVIGRFRRRGIGRAMTQAILLAGRERGATRGVLQASEMGRPVYEALGFETFTDYALHTGARQNTN